jgi:hypothetical protein
VRKPGAKGAGVPGRILAADLLVSAVRRSSIRLVSGALTGVFNTRKVNVGTVKKSNAAITSRWLFKKASQRFAFSLSVRLFQRCR